MIRFRVYVKINIFNIIGIYYYFIFCLKGIFSYKIEFMVYGNMCIRKIKMYGIFFFLENFFFEEICNYLE